MSDFDGFSELDEQAFEDEYKPVTNPESMRGLLMSCDIIATVAWSCGERDKCKSPGGWHMSNYWIDDEVETGYTVDNYADGDHDEVEEEDLPTPEAVVASWAEYAEWVAGNGLDPLGNYMIPKDVTTRTIRYSVTLVPSILGPIIIRLRRNGHTISTDEIRTNADLRQYLDAVEHAGRWLIAYDVLDGDPVFKAGAIPRLEDIASFNHLTIRGHRLVVPFTIDERRPDADAREHRWLVAKASEKEVNHAA